MPSPPIPIRKLVNTTFHILPQLFHLSFFLTPYWLFTSGEGIYEFHLSCTPRTLNSRWIMLYLPLTISTSPPHWSDASSAKRACVYSCLASRRWAVELSVESCKEGEEKKIKSRRWGVGGEKRESKRLKKNPTRITNTETWIAPPLVRLSVLLFATSWPIKA